MSATEEEIHRSAKLWLDQHGGDAVEKARDIVAAMQAAGDVGGADEWLRIIVAMEELQRGFGGVW